MDINIYLIARTAPTHGLAQWLRDKGASEEFIDGLPDSVTGAGSRVIGAAAKRCYLSFDPGLNPNITKVRRDWFEYFEHVIGSGHGSVLEHASYSFAIEGVSRVFTAEMNRHRAGWAISEGSMRYIRMKAPLPFWMPTCFRDEPDDCIEVRRKKMRTRSLFDHVFNTAGLVQEQLAEIWGIDDEKHFSIKKQLTSAFRRLVPMGVATGGVWTGNVRALRHVIATRSTPEAEEEIAHVFSRIGKIMVEEEPMLFADFTQTNGFWTPAHRKV